MNAFAFGGVAVVAHGVFDLLDRELIAALVGQTPIQRSLIHMQLPVVRHRIVRRHLGQLHLLGAGLQEHRRAAHRSEFLDGDHQVFLVGQLFLQCCVIRVALITGGESQFVIP